MAPKHVGPPCEMLRYSMELVCQAENEDKVYSIIEKYEYECLDSLKCGTQL